MHKIDLKTTHKDLFTARQAPKFVDVPPLRYFMIDGRGAPESDTFQEAIQALYSTAYTLKFALKKAGRTDFVVAPLEALWWSDDPRAFDENRRDRWRWTAMVMQPEHVGDADLGTALAELQRKGIRNPAHERLRLDSLEEGRAAQLLYVGPYNEMGTVRRRAEHVRRDGGIPGQRTPPRHLPVGSAADGARKAQDHPAPAGRARVVNRAGRRVKEMK